MGRYRPPRPVASKYITPEGKTNLQNELDFLLRVKRPEVTQAVSEAAAQGDRSENAEYIYGKKQLREIDSRIRFLTKRLENMVVVDRAPDDQKRIFFGAWVELEDESGDLKTWRIVGPDEFDVKKGLLSMDAPLAKALFRRCEGDEVELPTPEGGKYFYISKVYYKTN